MFFKTQLQSVGIGDAIDTSGRRLHFIGNLPAQAGDYVYTDGNVIFGHVPKKGAPSIPIVQPVIPVLGKDVRGYVTKAGDFKDYSIIADDWIVNNKFFFFHGKSEIGGKHIVDANVSKSGELLLAAGGEYGKYKYVTLNNQLWIERRLTGGDNHQYNEVIPYSVLYDIRAYTGESLIYGVNDKPDEDISLNFYQNNQLINSVNLKKYADLAENLALKIKNQIMAESNKDADAVNYTSSPDPPNDFVAASYARVANVHISDTGDWDAVIVSSSYGYCFPYQTLEGSVFKGAFYGNQDKRFSTELVECISAFEESVFVDKKLPINLDISKYPEFTGDTTVDGEYTETYKQYVLDKCAYYIPRSRFKFYRWLPMLFSACVIVKVHNDEVEGTIYSEAGGGTKISDYPFCFCWDERHVYNSPKDAAFQQYIQLEKNNWQFPIGDDIDFEADGLRWLNFIDKKNGTFIPISDYGNSSAHLLHWETYLDYPLRNIIFKIDSNANQIARQTGSPVSNILGRDIIRTAPLYHYINAEDDLHFAVPTYPKSFSDAYLSGWFRYDDDVYSGYEIRLNHCLKRLGGNQFLVGTKDGYLIKISADGTTQLVCYELKNFRLNELSYKSKALDK